MTTPTLRPVTTGVRSPAPTRLHRRRRAHRALHLAPPNAVAPRVTPYLRWVKPALDRAVAALLLLLLAPFVVPFVVLLWLIPGEPVLVRDRRVGRGGDPIDLLRFRTRGRGLDGRVGRWVERVHLDATARLINVLRGDLSLVGPRPERPEAIAGYDSWEHARHAVRPGLTGLWAVDPRRCATGRLDTALDVVYVGTVGWRTDMRILLRAVARAATSR